MEVSNGWKASKTRLPRDVPLNQWLSAPGWFLSPRGHLAISGDTSGCYTWGGEGATGI